ncbi:MFS transporter [Clostridium celatum]|uniref:Transporter, major facilitator family protein n=1 Tax=Clostridium celatum DSM 1785 TaxID=545697 RepID=L1QID9_9CLOT|nr:MFS transporter [Clostridium celatum]EKY27743.1 transporter, major facilitator family protein [Clostridium celatum DSM 1785]MCE9656080.1 MFS transporter [Clostridium celatum]
MILDLISKKEEQVKSFNMGDKVGYAFGDFGCAAFFAFVSSYLMVFYTDVLGVSAAAVGTLFVVARFWDAINDPIMGVLLDKAQATKHGKFRPYVIRFGLPMVIVGILAFTAIPGLPDNLKLPYAYVTYILYGMLYTAVNIPYGSLASVMTNDSNERTALSTFRNLGSMLANILVMVLVPKIIFNAQGEVTAEGFIICAVILAIISTVSFFFNFRLTRERIVHKTTNSKKGIIETVGLLFRNRAFLGVAIASFLMLGGTFTLSSLNVYIFKDYFKATNFTALGGMIGMVASVVVIPFAGAIVRKLGKKESAVLGSTFAASMYIVMLFIPNLTVSIFLVLSFLAGLGSGLVNTIIWALVSDAIDYQEYTTGERNEGTVYSSYSLARKLGQVISGGMGGFALSLLGYQSGATVQAESIGIGIKNIGIGMAAGGFILTTIVLIFVYNLSKKKVAEMNKALEERRAA